MTTFADLGVSETCARALTDGGILAPFPVQSAVIPDAMAGHDVLVQSPTGSGKTIAFGLPIVETIEATDRRAAALVLAPTRELATQIVEDIRPLAQARALSIAAVYGGVGIVAQAKRAEKAHIIVATPGRLIDLLDRREVDLRHIRMVVLDEADRMLDMGFRPAVDRILRETPAARQTLFFSATLDGAPRQFADSYTKNAREHRVAAPVSLRSAKIAHRFVPVAHADKLDVLATMLEREERGLAVVFVRTKRGADRLVKRLSSRGVNAVAMHGDKSQGQRERALASFERGDSDTLVATDVAARGLDVADVTHVINFDVPEDRDTYTHRAGRTGRAGREGTAVTLVMPDQERDVAAIARELDISDELLAAGIRSNGSGPSGPGKKAKGSVARGGHPVGAGGQGRGGRGRGGQGGGGRSQDGGRTHGDGSSRGGQRSKDGARTHESAGSGGSKRGGGGRGKGGGSSERPTFSGGSYGGSRRGR